MTLTIILQILQSAEHFYWYLKCHYAECRYAECRGATKNNMLQFLFLILFLSNKQQHLFLQNSIQRLVFSQTSSRKAKSSGDDVYLMVQNVR
jgi:hypothetical protein